MNLKKIALGLAVAVSAVVLSGCHFGMGHHQSHNGYHDGHHADMHQHYDYNGAASACHYCHR